MAWFFFLGMNGKEQGFLFFILFYSLLMTHKFAKYWEVKDNYSWQLHLTVKSRLARLYSVKKISNFQVVMYKKVFAVDYVIWH